MPVNQVGPVGSRDFLGEYDEAGRSLPGIDRLHRDPSCYRHHPRGVFLHSHYHVNCESAIYVSKGRGRFLVGERLETSLPIGPGDFLYIPAEAVHQPVNDGDQPMELIVARNTPVEIVVEMPAGQADAS